MKDYKQLNETQRDIIQILIQKKLSFTDIGNAIEKDRTTISKEVRRNRYFKSADRHYDQGLIDKAIDECTLLQKPPYVCNGCDNIRCCIKRKLFYNAKIAQLHYEEQLIQAREGYDIDSETVEQIEHSIIPLIKNKKQSINQVFTNHNDILYMSKVTFYKYVNAGVFSLTNLDLPKKVKYKKRKAKGGNKREIALLKNRTYEDFILYTAKNTDKHIVEMDTVIGTLTSNKVLLTIYFRDTHFMIIRLLDKKNVENVNAAINKIKYTLGISLYSKIFKIGLTDRGVEFYDPYNYEKDMDTGRNLAKLFYCDANCPNQKGGIEKNHEYIRMVFPTGYNFDNLTEAQIARLENNINNIPRDSLNGETPYQVTKKKYPKFISSLGYYKIEPDDVTLNINDILGGGNND
jgi:IS30 family transposase